ncbi:fasciclin domain-containing protein [Aureisphaera galaxeae]|uniref:fasciclin domain-containing protein n=1 Tax=Aureisphaera galaxeae TaxID=1538023 RepID=UPI00234FC45A|nr:fasciclin domain-containing protein [Aureisphaera galaxeae]MDC8006107.1 fasciclin domain-containing protein [Aureisphaera galaxeae]
MMKMIRFTLSFLCAGLILISCKSDPEKQENQVDTNAPAKEETVVKQLNNKNLLVKTMATQEAKTFTSALVTTGLSDVLDDEGPYTVFAPSVAAFDAMNKNNLNFYLNPTNKEAFITLIKNHIIEGDLSSADLLQNAKKSSNYEVKTLGDAVLKVSMKDGNIFLTDAKGNEATLGKTDILASNGKLHLLDKVLSVNVK